VIIEDAMADLTAQNVAVRQDVISPAWGYSQALRAIGQALEALNIRNFELTPVDDGYAIQGTYFDSCQGDDELSLSHVRTIWARPNGWQGTSNSQLRGSNDHAALELRYSCEDIERLEQGGRAKRLDAHSIADASKLSQMLRCIGFYLSQKCVRMQRLIRDGDSVSVEYETSLGSKIKETFGVADLYNFWVRSYLHRAERAQQQSEPLFD
jgi:hypothetical protein